MENNEYTKWVESITINPEIKEQLLLMSEREIEDAFSSKLEFGTSGIRGKIGPGSNRINHYTIAKTTAGFIKYLKNKSPKTYEKGIVIAYDNRRFSQEFAALVANLFASEKIKVYLFENLTSSPQLSYMIRTFKCVGGVNITASHNPSSDNGFKVYDENGCQILPPEIKKILKYVDEVKNELAINIDNFEKNDQLIYFLSDEHDLMFIEEALNCSLNNIITKSCGILYTPLHGTGSRIIPRMLDMAGYTHIFCVDEQMINDENFPTLTSPNPEDYNAFDLGIKKANKLRINYVIANDPDASRVGICIRSEKDNFKLLSGNELGALLLEYILSSRSNQGVLKNNSLIIDTIVTSDLGKAIASKYNVANMSCLPGFKYIGDYINKFNENKEFQFEFAYEESLGFINNSYVRDKDGIGSVLVIVEMINYYESKGLSLQSVLNSLYDEHGYYQNKQISIILEPAYAKERIELIMNHFRNGDLVDIANHNIVAIGDYESKTIFTKGKQEKTDLPSSNVLKIWLSNDSWIAMRPSGTQPKMKFYLSAKALSLVEAKNNIIELQNFINITLDDLFI